MFDLEVYPSPENFTRPLVAMFVTSGMSASRSKSCPLTSSGSCFYVISIHQIYLIKCYKFGKVPMTRRPYPRLLSFHSMEFPLPAALPGAADSCWNPAASPWWLAGGHQSDTGNGFQQPTAIDKESWDYTHHSYHRLWNFFGKYSVRRFIVIKPRYFSFPQDSGSQISHNPQVRKFVSSILLTVRNG